MALELGSSWVRNRGAGDAVQYGGGGILLPHLERCKPALAGRECLGNQPGHAPSSVGRGGVGALDWNAAPLVCGVGERLELFGKTG